MSLRSGFYNSMDGDRKYNASDMNRLFDGLISDGVFANIGDLFKVTVEDGPNYKIKIGTGKGWFHNTWIYNDTPCYRTLDPVDGLFNCIDGVFIEIDKTDNGRMGNFVIKRGELTTDAVPKYPTFESKTDIYRYPIAYINRPYGKGTIEQADITNVVGNGNYGVPYVTALLKGYSIDNIVAQWQDQFLNWMADEQAMYDSWITDLGNELGVDDVAVLEKNLVALNTRLNNLVVDHELHDAIIDSDGNIILDSHDGPIQAGAKFVTEDDLSYQAKGVFIDRLNYVINSSDWVSDDAYSNIGYYYKTSIPMNGITKDSIPEVILDERSSVTENVSHFSDTSDGYINLYSSIPVDVTVVRATYRNPSFTNGGILSELSEEVLASSEEVDEYFGL